MPVIAFAQGAAGGGGGGGGTGAAGLSNRITTFILTQVFTALVGIVTLMLFYYAIRMIAESQDEGAIAKARKSFVYALIGFTVLAVRNPIIQSFTTAGNGNPFNEGILGAQFGGIIGYIVILAEAIMVLMITFVGLQLIVGLGDEGAAESAKKRLLQYVAAAVLISLSRAIALIVVTPGGQGIQRFYTEMYGLLSLVLTLLGAASVLAMIVAGILLIVSVDEALKERAKKIVIGTIIALVLTLMSYALATVLLRDQIQIGFGLFYQ